MDADPLVVDDGEFQERRVCAPVVDDDELDWDGVIHGENLPHGVPRCALSL